MNNIKIKKIAVDYREVSHGINQKNFKKQIFNHFGEDIVSVERLSVADFVITLEDGTKIAIERKEDLDWISSCVKRRIQSQSIKMVENFDYRFIIIIGGYSAIQNNREYIKFSKKQWISNMVSLTIRYKVPVFMVESKLDFLKTIDSIVKMIDRNTEPLKKPTIIRDGKNIKTNILGSIPTIGKVKAKNLLFHFGSIQSVANASKEELLKVEKITEKNVTEIMRWLK